MKAFLYLVSSPVILVMILCFIVGIYCLWVANKRIDKSNEVRTQLILAYVIYILFISFGIFVVGSAIFSNF